MPLITIALQTDAEKSHKRTTARRITPNLRITWHRSCNVPMRIVAHRHRLLACCTLLPPIWGRHPSARSQAFAARGVRSFAPSCSASTAAWLSALRVCPAPELASETSFARERGDLEHGRRGSQLRSSYAASAAPVAPDRDRYSSLVVPGRSEAPAPLATQSPPSLTQHTRRTERRGSCVR
jgi:hypothetical protein